MDILIEILIEIYMELMLLVIPKGSVSKKYIWVAKVAAITVTLGVIALAIWGIVLIWDYQKMWGMIPLGIATAISLTQIIAGIILFKKRNGL